MCRFQKENKDEYRIIEVAALRFPKDEDKGKCKFTAIYWPHFGLIFNINEEMIKNLVPKGVVRCLASILPWHRDPSEWDFVEMEKDKKYLLLVPKFYALFTLMVLTFFIRLVPKQKTGAAKA